MVIIMKKIFLYLFPIKEYTSIFLLDDDILYDKWNVPRPLPILNECIQKRYRELGYEIVFVTYPDREIFGINQNKEDTIITTDITFDENSAIDSLGNEKKNFIPKYPNIKNIIDYLGEVKSIVVGGYHYNDCVKRLAKFSHDKGIDTTIDLELTDIFFSVYRHQEYFKIDEYDKNRFMTHMMSDDIYFGYDVALKQFKLMYSDPIYGFFK